MHTAVCQVQVPVTGLEQGRRPPASLYHRRWRHVGGSLTKNRWPLNLRDFPAAPALSSRGLVDPPEKRHRSLKGVRSSNPSHYLSEVRAFTKYSSRLPRTSRVGQWRGCLDCRSVNTKELPYEHFNYGMLAHNQVPPEARGLFDNP